VPVRPGDVIVPSRWRAQLKVSRTAGARGAESACARRATWFPSPGSAYTVTPLNLAQLRDLFQIRIRLECLAAELAAAAFTTSTQAAFAEAGATPEPVGKRLAARPPSDPEVIDASMQLHRRFHEMISDVSGNRRLTALIGTCRTRRQRFWALIPGWLSTQLTFLATPGHQESL